jgi:hypothetical protein
LFAACISKAQFFDHIKPSSISATYNYGFLIAHRANMAHLPKRNTKGMELNFARHDHSNTSWTNLYKGAVRGLSLRFQDFGNPEELGQAYSIFGHTSFPLIQGPKFGFLDFRLGMGFAYVTKKFDTELNPKNNAIGSHMNGYVSLLLNWSKYYRWWHYGFGIEFSHYSSSAMKVPNLGLNVPSFNFNVGYNFEERTTYKERDGSEESNYDDVMKDAIYLVGVFSAKQNVIKQKPAKSRPVIALQGLYDLKIGDRWKLNVAGDIIYNGANRHYYDTSTYSIPETLQLGVYVGASIHYYKTEFMTGMGVYFWSPVRPFGIFYHRLGFRYHFTNNFMGIVGIKSHFAIADYLEIGVGYRLWKHK